MSPFSQYFVTNLLSLLFTNFHCLCIKSKRISEKYSSASLTMLKPLTVWITTNCGKFLKRLPDHLTCLLQNLHASQKGTVRTGHGKMDWFKIGKGAPQGCILSLRLFNLYAEYIMGWMKHKLESRLQRQISITSYMQMPPSLWQKAKSN